jgi:hypothetical protein
VRSGERDSSEEGNPTVQRSGFLVGAAESSPVSQDDRFPASSQPEETRRPE